MIFPEQLMEMGINAPKEHQRIISKLTTGLGILFYHEGSIDLEPLPETMIDEGQTSPVPDVSLYNNQTFQTPVIIEVCHPNGVKNDFKKVQRLIDEFDYGTIEGFVYDYVNDTWQKYVRGSGLQTEGRSFSEVLQVDLATLL
jgi:Uma2 family endonuclease